MARPRFRPFLTAALLALAGVPMPALAQDAGWFAGLGIGSLKTSDGCPAAAAPGADCDDEDTTWKIFGGYRFTPHFGYELALVDMGERPASLAGIGPATARFRIFEALLVGTVPIGRALSAYGKAGLFHWDIDYDLPPGFIGSADANGNDYAFGLGVRYNVSRNAALRAEWQRYTDVGEPAATGKFDVDTFGVGALISF